MFIAMIERTTDIAAPANIETAQALSDAARAEKIGDASVLWSFRGYLFFFDLGCFEVCDDPSILFQYLLSQKDSKVY